METIAMTDSATTQKQQPPQQQAWTLDHLAVLPLPTQPPQLPPTCEWLLQLQTVRYSSLLALCTGSDTVPQVLCSTCQLQIADESLILSSRHLSRAGPGPVFIRHLACAQARHLESNDAATLPGFHALDKDQQVYALQILARVKARGDLSADLDLVLTPSQHHSSLQHRQAPTTVKQEFTPASPRRRFSLEDAPTPVLPTARQLDHTATTSSSGVGSKRTRTKSLKKHESDLNEEDEVMELDDEFEESSSSAEDDDVIGVEEDDDSESSSSISAAEPFVSHSHTSRKFSESTSRRKPSPKVHTPVPSATDDGRRKRAKKDPSAPKRPTSNYMFWCAWRRPSLRALNPELPSNILMQKIALEWKTTVWSTEEKRHWMRMQELDQARYKRQMDQWKATGSYEDEPPVTEQVDSNKVSPVQRKKARTIAPATTIVVSTPVSASRRRRPTPEQTQQSSPCTPGLVSASSGASASSSASTEAGSGPTDLCLGLSAAGARRSSLSPGHYDLLGHGEVSFESAAAAVDASALNSLSDAEDQDLSRVKHASFRRHDSFMMSDMH